MTPYFLFLIGLSCSVLHLVQASGCDDEIIYRIKAFWGIHIPKDIIKTAIDNKKEVVVATTEGYYEDDVTCITTVFGEDSFAIKRYHKKGDPTTENIKMDEKNGALYETDDTGVIRWRITIDEGVTAWYKCTKGDKQGKPQGAIKVKEGDYNKDAVEAAKLAMSVFFNLKLTKEYPDSCK